MVAWCVRAAPRPVRGAPADAPAFRRACVVVRSNGPRPPLLRSLHVAQGHGSILVPAVHRTRRLRAFPCRPGADNLSVGAGSVPDAASRCPACGVA